jgi:hypothetical protein
MLTWAILFAVAIAAAAITLNAARLWRGDRYLCDDCQFNQPELCNKPARPKATICFAYKRNV